MFFTLFEYYTFSYLRENVSFTFYYLPAIIFFRYGPKFSGLGFFYFHKRAVSVLRMLRDMTFLPLGFPTVTDKEEKMSKKKKQFFFSGYFL